MIHIGSDFAIWKKHIVSAEGEYLGAQNIGESFIVYERELTRRTERNVIPGTTSTVSEATVALVTSDNIASKIEADDTVIWRDTSYTVLGTSCERKKGGYMFQKSYLIYLQG